MRIKEWDNKIIFLHEVIEGVADRSYGIHVAQMAGLPLSTVARAAQVLAGLEQEKAKQGITAKDLPAYDAAATPTAPPKPFNPALGALLSTLDPDALSPKEALETLYKIKELGDAP